jgi:hypothetical protein
LDHLTCYRIKPELEFEKREAILRDQFGEQKVIVMKPDLLCVPSNKEDLGPIPPGDDDDDDD